MIEDLHRMLMVSAVCCLIVLVAMGIDLAAGLWKAKLRGEIRSSWGLKRTLLKFIIYIGSLFIASGIDVLLQLSRLFEVLAWEPLMSFPIVTCLIAIFQLVVEIVSIREKADDKLRRESDEALSAIRELLGRLRDKAL